jgi:SAM-dependent methyltransferase
MDLFEEGLRFARQRFQGRLIQGDIFQTSFPRQFDMIGAFDVIEHLDDDTGLLDRLWHLLRPGGHLVLTVPAHQALWSYFDEAAGHRRRYAPHDLKLKLATAGFSRPFVTQFMAALFPAMWLKRRFVGEAANNLSKATASQQQVAAESDLRIHPVLNSIFELLLSPEPWLISHRIRIPLGTSLLCLAQRPR